MFFVNDKEIKKLERDLELFAHRSIPFATKFALNTTARAAQVTAREDVKKEFITRNAFTRQSIQFRQAKSLNIRDQESAVGSTAPYMEDQEFGETKLKNSKQGIPLPTSYSAGQALNANPRTRLPRKPNKLENIRLKKQRKPGKTRRQQNLIAVKQAAQSGQKYVYMDLGRKQGIFKVVGTKKTPQIRMIYDLSNQALTIPKRAWLKPAVDKTIPKMPQFYKEALEFQARKHGMFE